jgi:hypothetical protein
VVERESSTKNEIQMRAMGKSREMAQMVPNPLNAVGGEAKVDDTVAVHSASSVVKKSLTIDFRFEDLGLQLKGSGISVLNGVTGEIKCGGCDRKLLSLVVGMPCRVCVSLFTLFQAW